MDFKRAAKFVIPWGDHKGKMIDDVARTDQGLRDLVRLQAWMEDKNHRSSFRQHLDAYLSDESIKKELEAL
jgi:hypothetical protein